MKKILLSTVALTVILSGCVATDPYTGQTTLTNTGGGSAIGAALGGFVGAVTAEEGDRGRGALRGALAGGVVGAGVGAEGGYTRPNTSISPSMSQPVLEWCCLIVTQSPRIGGLQTTL